MLIMSTTLCTNFEATALPPCLSLYTWQHKIRQLSLASAATFQASRVGVSGTKSESSFNLMSAVLIAEWHENPVGANARSSLRAAPCFSRPGTEGSADLVSAL